jgi:primase-polymerase (primpol)-like protein
MKPVALDVRLDGIPAEMRAARRWVVHRAKVPFNPITGRHASSTDPATWGNYAQAYAALATGRYDGLGFVLGDGIAGVDLDKCRNPQTGAIEPWALAIIERLDSYTEVSPSGCGVHIFCRVDPAWTCGRKSGGIQIYTRSRYFTVTGQAVR